MPPLEAYFDESYSDHGDRHFCVAGYVFEHTRGKELAAKWASTLARFNLPYFRMSACAHGNDPFDKLTKHERISIAAEMIAHVQNYAMFGMFTSVSNEAIQRVEKDPVDPFNSAYSLLCYLSLIGISQWAEGENYSGSVSYFFEAGSAFQREANKVMDDISKLPDERSAFRYASHAFVEKAVQQVQAADMLAWHAITDHRRRSEGLTKRADFKELLKCPTFARHVDEKKFVEYRNWWLNRPARAKRIFEEGRRGKL